MIPRIIVLILFNFTIVLSNAQIKASKIKNLVFEGGGVRGLAYAGALIELNEHKALDSIERVAGTSVGAIASTLYAVGYSPDQILKLIYDLEVKSFADGHWMFIGGTKRMIRNFGWYKGEKFNKWISHLIKDKTGKENLTFKELNNLSKSRRDIKQLYLTGTNLTLQTCEILCHETYPEMEIRTAVRISMSIPFFYEAVVINETGKVVSPKESKHGNVMVDGGILANFPIQIFDYQKYIDGSNDSTSIKNPQTLGLRLDRDEQIQCDQANKGLAPCEIKNMKDFTSAFYQIIHESINRNSLTKEDWERTVSISTGGIGPRIKKMPESQKNLLVENGKIGVRNYFKKE